MMKCVVNTVEFVVSLNPDDIKIILTLVRICSIGNTFALFQSNIVVLIFINILLDD